MRRLYVDAFIRLGVDVDFGCWRWRWLEHCVRLWLLTMTMTLFVYSLRGLGVEALRSLGVDSGYDDDNDPSGIDLWFSIRSLAIINVDYTAFCHADHTSIKKSNKIFDEHSE